MSGPSAEPETRPGGRRRGISSSLVLVALGAILAFTFMAIRLAQVAHYKQQLQAGADAAVLAGAPRLMDRSHLYAGLLDRRPELDWGEFRRRLRAVQVEESLATVLEIASRNPVGGAPISLLEAEDELQVGWIEDPTAHAAPPAPWGFEGALNSLEVRAALTEADGDGLMRWLEGPIGLRNVDLYARARATVDQRVAGFRVSRPGFPLVPLVVSPNVHDEQLGPWSDTWWGRGPLDHVSFDPLRGEFRPGPDGIAEMVVRLSARQGGLTPPPSAWEVESRAGGLLVPGLAPEWLERGANPEDLAAVGGLLAVGQTLPAEWVLESSALVGLHRALLTLRGRERIWPIGDDSSRATGEGSCLVSGFAAGRLVDCLLDTDGSLVLVVEPCQLTTPEVFTAAGAPRNPWIGKLVLSR